MKYFRKFFFRIWYYKNPPWDTNQTPPELYRFMEDHVPGRALDLGCGTGTNVIMLAKHGWEAVGVDFIPKAIRVAKRKAKQEAVSADFHVGDVTQLKGISGPFDLILDIGCYHSLSEKGKERYRANIDRFLNPGGHFLLYCFFKPEDGDSFSGMDEADLEILSSQLKLIQREDGSERDIRKAAWLTYQKSET